MERYLLGFNLRNIFNKSEDKYDSIDDNIEEKNDETINVKLNGVFRIDITLFKELTPVDIYPDYANQFSALVAYYAFKEYKKVDKHFNNSNIKYILSLYKIKKTVHIYVKTDETRLYKYPGNKEILNFSVSDRVNLLVELTNSRNG